MQEKESMTTVFMRYLFWVLFALVTSGIKELAVNKDGLSIPFAIIFIIIGGFTSWMMLNRHYKEKLRNQHESNDFLVGITKNYGMLMIIVILISIIRIGVSFLQIKGMVPTFQRDYSFSSDQKVIIFNLLATITITSYQQLMVGSVFLNNYFFKKNSVAVAIIGVLISGIIFAGLTMPTNPVQFLVMFVMGIMYAIVYRRTKNARLTMLIVVFSNIMGTILI